MLLLWIEKQNNIIDYYYDYYVWLINYDAYSFKN